MYSRFHRPDVVFLQVAAISQHSLSALSQPSLSLSALSVAFEVGCVSVADPNDQRTRADLRAFYEEEARLRLRKPLTGKRVELRDAFLEQLRRERCCSVLDFGSGPGGDGGAFDEAGHRYVGIDLAHGNGLLAAEAGLTVIQSSLGAPPFRPESFDAGWSMSALMHVPERDVEATLRQMVLPLRSGAPLRVGLWGGSAGDVQGAEAIEGHRRLFSLRSLEANAELLATCTGVESKHRWDLGPDMWEYQVFALRVR